MQTSAALLAVVLAAGCASVPRNDAKLQPCRPEGLKENVLCGTVAVFENRLARSGRQIDLNVVVIPARQQKDKREPLFELAGGPGLAATDAVPLYVEYIPAAREHRDIVFIDQRGTGKSNGLWCDTSLFTPLTGPFPKAYVDQCLDASQKRADLRHYTTDNSADDLNDVRLALGYDRIHLNGLSYGTRLALVFARRHPDAVKSMVLIGPAPTWARIPRDHATTAERAIRTLFTDCRADAACNATFPSLEADYDRLIAQLERNPYRLTRSDQTSTDITRFAFTNALRSRLYDPESNRSIPRLITEAARGDFGRFDREVLQRKAPPMYADGLYLSIICSEDTMHIEDFEGEVKRSSETSFGANRLIQQREACEKWPRAAIAESFFDDVKSNVPALIIAGRLDPVAPFESAERIARNLPQSRLVILQHGAHVPMGLNPPDCFDRAIIDFLDRGLAADTSCLNDLTPLPFATK